MFIRKTRLQKKKSLSKFNYYYLKFAKCFNSPFQSKLLKLKVDFKVIFILKDFFELITFFFSTALFIYHLIIH